MKYALITGGSRGIGRAVCYKLAEMKYHILLNYINNDDEAQITKEQIMLKGVKCELIKFDVSDKEACEQILGTWIENNKESTIEVLVNNAGKRQDNLFVWMTDLQWKEVISTSLDSFFM